ncbi:MAG: glycosyltransferase family 2 protein [Planctomycetes bacterium]|nr:glycosyltransferase family 2 protein [Planctomycetota bacterium]
MNAFPGSQAAPDDARARTAVVIVHYRTPALVLDCLETLVPELDPGRDVAVVVDNASADGSAETLRAALAQRAWSAVRFVESPVNGGFSAGNNVGIAAVDADAYLLLNSDTLVRPGALAALRAALDSSPDVGLVGPRLEWPDGEAQTSCFRQFTPFSELIRGSRTGLVRRLLARWDVPLPVGDEPCEPEWMSFAAVLVRRAVLERVGPLDEGFFMFFEDADYCRSARRAGWRLRHEPRAHVVHLRGGTSPVKALAAARKRGPRYWYAARARYYRKRLGTPWLLLANLMWTLGRALAWVREVLRTKRPHTVEHELFDTWRG